MKNFMIACLAMLVLLGCKLYNKDPYAYLIETEEQLVANCIILGVISEIADADQISDTMATRRMVQKIKEKADRLGATHIVWLHKTDEAAAAKIYQCIPPVE